MSDSSLTQLFCANGNLLHTKNLPNKQDLLNSVTEYILSWRQNFFINDVILKTFTNIIN